VGECFFWHRVDPDKGPQNDCCSNLHPTSDFLGKSLHLLILLMGGAEKAGHEYGHENTGRM